ncbi:MAG: helix-turn-helix domain-containing protein [Clostridia bacterium]|nr:helix-turn-helix domain-containing protein [Clostridia bacterium]
MVILVVDEKQNENLKFLEFGILDPKIKKGWGPGVREYYMVHFILDGEGYFNGQLLKKGNFFTSKPYQKIHYFPKPNNEWHYVWFLLKGDGVEDFLSEYGLYPETGVGKFRGVEEITKLCSTFFIKGIKTVNSETAINWAKLLCSYNKETSQGENVSVKQKHLVRATEYIQGKYHEGISPKNVAEFVGLDEKYLYSIFKAYLKISVQEYLNNLRIEKAKVLLEKSDLNISEIAYSIGIDDPLNFSRFFKHIVGVSPRKYRENLK